MKLCVTSKGQDLDSKVEYHFGRAPCFIIIDTDSMKYEAVENTVQAIGRGAGVSAAQLVLDKSPAAVLTGIIGPNAFEALKFAHVEVYEGLAEDETVGEAVEKFKKGEYTEATEPAGGPARK